MFGTSCVVPWTRASAWLVDAARCASSSAKEANSRPASGLRFTYFTPDSTIPLVRARYGAHAFGVTPQLLQNATYAGWKVTVCSSRPREITQGLRVVSEELPRDAAEMRERLSDLLTPVVLPLGKNGLYEDASRVAEDRGEQVHPNLDATNPDLLLAEVDLHLATRLGLDPDRRQLLGTDAPSVALHGSLYGTDTELAPFGH